MENQQFKFCRMCGKQLKADARFCRYCGYEFTNMAQQKQEPEPPKIQARVCNHCGNQVSPEAAFCKYCGSTLSENNAVPIGAGAMENAARETMKVRAMRSTAGEGMEEAEAARSAVRTGAEKGAAKKSFEKKKASRPKKKKSFFRFVFRVALLALLVWGSYKAWENRELFIKGITDGQGKVEGTNRNKAEGKGEEGSDYVLYDSGMILDADKATLGIGLPLDVRYTEEEKGKAPTYSAEVSSESPVVTLDGITVDFGANLGMLVNEDDEDSEFEDDKRVFTLRTLPEKEDVKHGCTVMAWDFDLGDKHEFLFPVVVTVPFGDIEDPYNLVAQHFNEDLGLWEYIAYDIDTDQKTVTFYLNHFSEALIANYKSETTQQLRNQDVPLTHLTVNLLPAKIERAMTTAAEAQTYVSTMLARNEPNTIEWLYQAANNSGNILTGDSGKSATLGAFMDLKGYLLSGDNVGFDIMGVSFCGIKLLRDYQRTGSLSEALMRNKSDLLKQFVGDFDFGSVVTLFAKGDIYKFCAQAVVYAFGKADAAYMELKYHGKESYLANAYETFTESRMYYVPKTNRIGYYITQQDFTDAASYVGEGFSKYENLLNDRPQGAYILSTQKGNQQGYVALMKRIMADYPDEPGKWVEKFDQYLEIICDYFFELPEKDQKNLIRMLNYGNDDWLWTRDSTIQLYKEDMLKTIRAELNKNGDFYANFMEVSYVQMKNLVYEDLGKQQDYMNQVLLFDLDFKDESGNKISFGESPKYQDKYIIFDLSNCMEQLKGTAPWEVKMDRTGGVFECTLNSYILAGKPTQLLVYGSYRDYLEKKQPVEVISVPEAKATVPGESAKKYSWYSLTRAQRNQLKDWEIGDGEKPDWYEDEAVSTTVISIEAGGDSYTISGQYACTEFDLLSEAVVQSNTTAAPVMSVELKKDGSFTIEIEALTYTYNYSNMVNKTKVYNTCPIKLSGKVPNEVIDESAGDGSVKYGISSNKTLFGRILDANGSFWYESKYEEKDNNYKSVDTETASFDPYDSSEIYYVRFGAQETIEGKTEIEVYFSFFPKQINHEYHSWDYKRGEENHKEYEVKPDWGNMVLIISKIQLDVDYNAFSWK